MNIHNIRTDPTWLPAVNVLLRKAINVLIAKVEKAPIQGPLKQMDGIAVNGPDIRKDDLKHCLQFMSKFF